MKRATFRKTVALWFTCVTLFLLCAHHSLSEYAHDAVHQNTDSPSIYEKHAKVQGFQSSSFGASGLTSQVLSMANFTVISTIGKGSFGSVKLARYIPDGREFAIKIVLKANMPELLVFYIKQEREIMQLIQHPYISSLAFAFQDEANLYFGMEFYPGGSLEYRMDQKSLMPREDVRLYAAELVLALSHIHSHNIIFRDLKPGNIMLDHDGHLRLVDFGISLQNITSCCTGVNNFAGTVPYMAPESFAKWAPYDHRDYGKAFDWWSVGIILYEMVSGANPFFDPKGDMNALMSNIVNAKINYPISKFDAVTTDFISAFLNRDPHQRLGADLTKDLAQIKAHPFFASIDWMKLQARQVEASWKPNVVGNNKLQYIPKSLHDQSEALHFTGFGLALRPMLEKAPPIMNIDTNSCHLSK